MDEHRDDLDTWLSVRVQPMLPSPGTFEAIQSKARRRRRRKAVLSAAGAVAAAAVAVAVIPQVVPGALHAGQQPVAGGPPSVSALPTPSASPPGGGTPTASPTPPPPVGAGLAPPAVSVTFVGAYTGWVLGQTMPRAQCDLPKAPDCLLLERTDLAGAKWHLAGAPPTHGPSGATGVSQVRFLDTSNGWAFGPQLWATHDAGQIWTQIPTHGLRVTSLEARGQRVFAVLARCSGTGPGFAGHCTRFTVYSSPAGSDQWVPVPGPVPGAGHVATAAALVPNGTTAYLIGPDGVLYGTSLTGGGWQPAAGTATAPVPLPCRPGAAQPDGQPSRALLAATAANDLALLCTGSPAAGQQHKTLYSTQDGGRSWHRIGNAPSAGTATSLSGSPSGTLVIATSLGIEVSTSSGARWSAARSSVPPGGFAYVGMTTAGQGVAVPAGPGQHGIWFTYNGARTWRPRPVG
jgi:photosystem II stability/assembly factor-like uncharacterized protein